MTRDLAYLMHLTSVLGATLKIYNFELQPLLLFTRPQPTPRGRAPTPHLSTFTCFHQCTYFYALPPEAPYPPFFTLHSDNHYKPSRFPCFDNPHAPFPFGALHLRSTTIRPISVSQHCVWDALESSSSSWRSVNSRFGHRWVGVKHLRARPTTAKASSGASLSYLVRLKRGQYTSESSRWI